MKLIPLDIDSHSVIHFLVELLQIIRWFKFPHTIVAVFKPILHAFQLFMLLVQDVLAQPIQYIFVSRTVP